MEAAACVPLPTPTSPSPTAAPTTSESNRWYELPREDTLSVDDVVSFYNDCLDNDIESVLLIRTWFEGWPLSYNVTVKVCPAQDIAKQDNTYTYTLLDNRKIVMTCGDDDLDSDSCNVSGDGLLSDIGGSCRGPNADCLTGSCIAFISLETAICSCHPLTNVGCVEGYKCSPEFTELPECLLDLGSPCSTAEECVTNHCADSTCVCNKDTNYPCDIKRGESCDLVDGSYSCQGLIPTSAPTFEPAFECVPTTGPCVSTFADLETEVEQATENDIIALCGNGIPLVTESEILFEKPNMALCCVGPKECIMASSGGHRNLHVTGRDSTLQYITFVNGTSTGSNGGNVFIDAPGKHDILGCKFENGQAIYVEGPHGGYGGNLLARNVDSLTITDSLFLNGKANDGGGAHVENAKSVAVTDSLFRKNEGGNNGGGIHFMATESKISIKNSVFEANTAVFGGAYFGSELGSFQRLEVLDCVFKENTSEGESGYGVAQTVLSSELSHVDLVLAENKFQDNFAGANDANCQDLFLIYHGTPGDACIGTGDDVINIASE